MTQKQKGQELMAASKQIHFFWTTVQFALTCHVLTYTVRVIEGEIVENDQL